MRDRSPLPWLHIAEEVATEAAGRGYRRLLVLGTRYLMEGPVYPVEARLRRGIECEIPDARDARAHQPLIFDEFVYGRFEDLGAGVLPAGHREGQPAAAMRWCSAARRSRC